MTHSLACLHAPALALASAVALLTLGGCGATGSVHTSGTVDPGFTDPLSFGFYAANDGTTFEVQGEGGTPNDYSNKCLEISWSDSSGEGLNSSLVQMDRSGHASGSVPDGAVHWEATIVDCPEEEDEPEGEKALYLGGAGAGGHVPEGPVEEELQLCLVLGGRVIPTDAPNEINLSYAFHVIAPDSAAARNQVRPVLLGGIGSQVPPAVRVLRWATAETIPTGLRLVTAATEGYERFDIDVNQGTFQASLGNDLTQRSAMGWSYIEVLIPQGSLAPVPPLGGTAENVIETVYASKEAPRLLRHEKASMRIAP